MANIEGNFSAKPYSYAHPYIAYSYSQDINGNFSDITAILHFYFTINYNGYNGLNTHSNTSNIDGNQSSTTTNFDGRGTQPKDISVRTVTQRVYHNSDGSRSCWIGWAGNTNIGAGTYNFGATVTLNTIPREAYMTSTADMVIGNNIPVSLYNPGNMYIRSWLQVDGGATNIKMTDHGQTSNTTITLGGGYDAALYAKCPNATALSIQIVIQTFSDAGYSNQIGSNRVQYGTAYVDGATNSPTFTTYTIASVDRAVAVIDKYSNTLVTSQTHTLTGSSTKLISGYSQLRGTITSANKAVAKNSATVSKYRFIAGSQGADGAYSSGSTVDIDIIGADSKDTTMTAYDSRSLTTAATPVSASIIVAYTPVVISSVVLKRDNVVDAASKLTLTAGFWENYFGSGTTSNPGSGTKNAVTAHYRYKETTQSWGAQSWISLSVTTNGNGAISFNNYINGDLGGSGFTTTKSYNVEVRVYDSLSVYILEGTLNRGIPLMDMTQTGIAINAIYDGTRGGNLQVAQPAWTYVSSFENSWVNYEASETNYNHCKYFKDSLGIVHLAGLVKSGTLGQNIFTLPTGYRPLKNYHFAVASNGAFGYCYVVSDGRVQASGGSNTWFDLGTIHFRAEQ